MSGSNIGEWFVENTSIFLLGISILILLVAVVKAHNFLPESISLFIAAAIGNFAMFTNGAYRGYTGGDNYKQVNLSGGVIELITNCWDGYCERVASLSVYRNTLLIIVLSSITLCLLLRVSKVSFRIKLFLSSVIVSFSSLVLLDNLIVTSSDSPIIGVRQMALFSVVYLLSILAAAVLSTDKREKQLFYIFISFSWVLSIGPMLVTTPCHDRSLFLGYIILIVLVITVLEDCDIKDDEVRLTALMISITVCTVMIIMSYMFIRNRLAYEEKIAYASEHKNASEIILPNLPYEDYVYKGSQDRITEIFDREFKLYYDINQNTVITLIPYEKWKEEVK